MTSEHDAGAASEPAPEPTADAGDTPAFLGRTLDERYRILRELGVGGMGAVFVAEHLTLHKEVALKVIRAELAGNGEVAARFAREAMATAQFEHPHVASAIDYGTLPEGGAYFVMQLVRGRALRSLYSHTARMPWRRACELCAQVADALSAAKAAGIIHRDLKPDNVLVEQREDGSDLVKVLDFGIAHVAPRESSSPADDRTQRQLTRVGTVMGTPGYMAPEQAVGDKVDHRTDLYAVGVVLWECIAGHELWEGPDLTTVVARQLTEPVPRLRDVTGDATLPAELDELLQRLTSRAPDGRPEHAAEVRDTLRRLAVSEAGRVSSVHRVVASLAPRVRTVLTHFREQPTQTQRAQLAVAALLGVALLSLLLRDGDEPAPAASGGTAGAAALAVVQEPAPPAQEETEDEDEPVVPEPPPKPKPAASGIPSVLAEDETLLLEGESALERKRAADAILAYRPKEAIPPHLRAIAELEVARSCKTRKRAIAEMRKQPDKRYLAPLERLARAPRSGCGFLSLGDCYRCIRPDLRLAIAAIDPEPERAKNAPGEKQEAP